MNKLRAIIATFMLVLSTVFVAAPSVAADTTPAAKTCSTHFLSFPAWYNHLTNADCSVKSPTDVGGLSNFIWTIAFNVVQIILQLIAYISTIMIIVGGFRFLTSAGNASGVEQGKKTLTNAIIGLVISIASIAIVNLIFGVITGFKG